MKKKLLPILLALCMVVSLLPAPVVAASFDDVEGHWGEAAIERWAGYGVLNGKGENIFDPNGVMTRAEFATMLVNMMGYTQTSDETFTDLDPEAWYADAISKLVAAGVMNGVGNGMVNPLGEITREQAAVMLCRAFGIQSSGNGSLTFNDSEKVSDWAVDAMTALSERGMINGVGGNLLSPDGIVNRATAAQLTSNMVAVYANEDTVVSGLDTNGVVVVVNGAKVEITDSTITAPIVVQSAEVTLTNTQAADVKAAGEKSSIVADEQSTVANVVLAGEAPTVEIKGAVEGTVTVEEGATGATANVPQGTNVSNESGGAVSVNGSEVESGTVATAPETPSTPSQPSTPSYPSYGGGSSSGGSTGGTTTPTTPDVSDGSGSDVAPPENDEAHVHSWTIVANDNATHKKTCTCGEVQYEAHTWEEGTCTECKAKKPEETTTVPEDKCTGAEDGEHDFSGTPVTVDATCTSAGSITYTCQNDGCTEKKVTTIPALGHNYKVETTAATCGETGKTVYTCQNDDCEDTKTETIAATGQHKWDAGVATTKATCQKAGVKTFTCSVCETTKDETIPVDKDAHTLEKVDAVAAACEKEGNTAGYRCTNEGCTYTTVTKTEALEHKWGAWGPEGGDSEQYIRHCTRADCDGEDTCSHTELEGKDSGTCSVCGYVKKAVEPEPEECKHENKKVVSANETQHKTICEDCSEQIGEEENHQEEEYGEVKGNCHTATVTAGKKCSVCGYVIQEPQTGSVVADAHDWVDGTCKNGCGETHTGDDHKDSDGDGKCDVCGGTITTPEGEDDLEVDEAQSSAVVLSTKSAVAAIRMLLFKFK